MNNNKYQYPPTAKETRNKILKIIYFIFYIASIFQVILLLGLVSERGETLSTQYSIPVLVFGYGGYLIFKQLFKKGG